MKEYLSAVERILVFGEGHPFLCVIIFALFIAGLIACAAIQFISASRAVCGMFLLAVMSLLGHFVLAAAIVRQIWTRDE